MKRLRKKPTMQDIADRLGISRNAVSIALNNKPGVSKELREKVFKVAQDLNYINLGHTKEEDGNYLLVIIHESYLRSFHSYYYHIFGAMEKHAKQLGYHALLTTITTEMEKDLTLPSLFYNIGFKGILLIGAISREYTVKLTETNLPVVMVIHNYIDLPLDYVIQSNEEGAYTIVKYLFENGHRRIGYIGPIQRISSFRERLTGYKRVMEEEGLENNEKYCIMDDDVSLFDYDVLKCYIGEMSEYPTAWFCGNDALALSLIKILTDKGLNVPEDVSVAGFDNIEAASLISPSLTTIYVKTEDLGIKAVETIIDRINKRGCKTKISIYGQLVIGDSVKKID